MTQWVLMQLHNRQLISIDFCRLECFPPEKWQPAGKGGQQELLPPAYSPGAILHSSSPHYMDAVK